MVRSKIIVFILLVGFVFNRVQAQRPYDFDVETIIGIAEMDYVGCANWARSMGLEAQVIQKGPHTIRQWVPEGAPEEGYIAVGLSACAGIEFVVAFPGLFRFTCEGKYLDAFVQDALKAGFALGGTAPLSHEASENENGYVTHIRFERVKAGEETPSEIHIAICNGWMELKYTR